MTEKLFIDREIRCLHCRRHFNVREYQKVELPRQQELILYILDGSIFEFECPHCREEYTVLKDQEEFVIDNQEKKYRIYYSDNEYDSGVKLMQVSHGLGITSEEEKDFVLEVRELDEQGYRIRFEANYSAAVEKMVIFEAGLNDVAVELLKAFMELQYEFDKEFHRLVFIDDQDRAFVGVQDNRPVFAVEFDEEEYEAILEEFAEECASIQYEVDTYEIKKIMKKRLEELEEDEN
ncbi:CpXC domain-containing protein [uncultured Granulicatella sp.]|uniref:CpXC domain-containing protein n=1 Tax=uncultured Granulicatella sp. TaxID=316089 RepID=UPI0028D661CC|nr:CpXC domain-containing protein [uncultured Granulicatella sp.]